MVDQKKETTAVAKTGAVEALAYAEKRDLAKTIAMSKLVEWTPEQTLVMGMKAEAEGMLFIQALDHFDIIMGKPARKAISFEAKYRAAGGRIKFLQRDEKACIAEFTNPDGAAMKFSWTKEDADTYMVYEKGNVIPISKKSNWQGRKKLTIMLSWRTIAEGCRAMMPEAFLNCYIPDEVEESSTSVEVEATVNEPPGGVKSESFTPKVVPDKAEPVSEAVIMMEPEQRKRIAELCGNAAAVTQAVKNMYGKQKKNADLTALEAADLIRELERAASEAEDGPTPENAPESKPAAPESKPAGKVTRPDEIDLDGEDDFKEEF